MQEKIADVTEINQLITLGKEKGYLTYEEVNDVLPSDVVAPEQIDDLMHLFGENEIDIVDTAIKGEKLALNRIEDQEEKEEPAAEEEEDLAVAKADAVSIDDPVRMYLREMGTISLLTREGEVEIAKRIEEGQNEVNSSVANCSVTVNEIIKLGEKLKKAEINVFEIIKVAEPEEKKEQSEKEESKKLLKSIQNLKVQHQKLQTLRKKLESSGVSQKAKAKLAEEEKKQRVQVEKIVSDLNLSGEVMDKII
ncbi:MAG: RNA polymerase sigma factor RpoD, partial [Nitrospinae bacterium]|nr:RNA polymerase sigma factor RpoD [Nitrospinota bacterium]